MPSSDLDILILAAGKGTRMRSDLPKVLHSLWARPLIEHVLDAADALRPREVGVIVGHGREQVKEALAGRDLTFVVQRAQKGTGHAIRSAKRAFAGRDGHVLVLSGDVPLIRPETLKALVTRHRRSKAAVTLLTADLDEPGSLGRIVRDRRGAFRGIVEVKHASDDELAIREINAGIYVFRNDVLFGGLDRLQVHRETGEIYLTDLPTLLAEAGERVAAVGADDADDALGINTTAELRAAREVLRTRILDAHAACGVEVVDGSSTFIDKGVTIGPGTVVWPFSVLRAGVSIGARCRIGPFAHLRPGTVLEDGAVVGSFVETKNATVGAGALALHLAYLGDTTVGAGANIGAGTITANYDGVAKHRTTIGDDAFIGSGTKLVAPVEVGDGATTGAGAVVTHDVPPGDVVVGVPARSTGRPNPKGRTRRKKRTKKSQQNRPRR